MARAATVPASWRRQARQLHAARRGARRSTKRGQWRALARAHTHASATGTCVQHLRHDPRAGTALRERAVLSAALCRRVRRHRRQVGRDCVKRPACTRHSRVKLPKSGAHIWSYTDEHALAVARATAPALRRWQRRCTAGGGAAGSRELTLTNCDHNMTAHDPATPRCCTSDGTPATPQGSLILTTRHTPTTWTHTQLLQYDWLPCRPCPAETRRPAPRGSRGARHAACKCRSTCYVVKVRWSSWVTAI